QYWREWRISGTVVGSAGRRLPATAATRLMKSRCHNVRPFRAMPQRRGLASHLGVAMQPSSPRGDSYTTAKLSLWRRGMDGLKCFSGQLLLAGSPKLDGCLHDSQAVVERLSVYLKSSFPGGFQIDAGPRESCWPLEMGRAREATAERFCSSR